MDAYDLILANSRYTQEWIRRLWHHESEVLYPPIAVVGPQPAAHRDKIVLSVGRFITPGLGHAKRQLEMVQWFGELVRSGRLPDWKMRVVGGCEVSQLPYLRRVQAAAQGLPISVEANVSREAVQRLYSTAAIFWSATGYGQNESAHPWSNEHFGMTTVEAMSGGCVPIVIDRAGGREIVRHLEDGYPLDLPAGTAALYGTGRPGRRIAGEDGPFGLAAGVRFLRRGVRCLVAQACGAVRPDRLSRQSRM